MIGWIPAPFFAVNIIGWEGMWDSFARWGYPSWFHLLNGVLQLVIAVLLVMDTTRLPGLGLGILFCLAIVATLIRHQEKAVPDLAHQRIVAVPARHALLVANGPNLLTIRGGQFFRLPVPCLGWTADRHGPAGGDPAGGRRPRNERAGPCLGT